MTFRTVAEQLREQARIARIASKAQLLKLQETAKLIRQEIETHQEVMANANRAVLAAQALERLEDEADGGGV